MTIAAPPRPSAALVTLPAMAPEDIKRINSLAARWKAFRGELDKPLKKKGEDDPDFNILDNRCAPVVEKGVSFLFGQALDIDVKLSEGPGDDAENADEAGEPGGPGDTEGTSEAQTYLDNALGDLDDFMTLLSEGAINGGVTGECFIKIIEADPDSGYKYPRLVVLNPETVWVETDPDDCRDVIAFNIQYKTKDAGKHDIIKRQRIWQEEPTSWTAQWYTQPVQPGMGLPSDQWAPLGEPVIWPWKFPPICYCSNQPNPNEFWGRPDLTDDLIAMNRHLNLVQSNIVKLLWFYSAPYLFIDSDQKQPLNVRPGSVNAIGEGVSVTAIQATGDIANARAFAADLRSDMDELSRVPAVALGRMADLPRGTISGVALQLLFQPLIEKTHQKRRLYGRMIRDLCQRILCLGGYGDGEDLPVDLHWPELLPDDEYQHLQALQLKEQLGWSTQTIMSEAGADYEEEMERKQAEAEDDQASYDQGKGPAPQAAALGKGPLPPEMQQNMQQPPAAFQAQQAKLTGGA